MYEVCKMNGYLKSEQGIDNIELKADAIMINCKFKSKYQIKFLHQNSGAYLLDFRYEENRWNESHNINDISPVCNILVHCNLVNGFYDDGTGEISKDLYDLSPKENHTEQVDHEPRKVKFL